MSESAASSAQAGMTAEGKKNMSIADDVIVMYYFLKVKFDAKNMLLITNRWCRSSETVFLIGDLSGIFTLDGLILEVFIGFVFFKETVVV